MLNQRTDPQKMWENRLDWHRLHVLLAVTHSDAKTLVLRAVVDDNGLRNLMILAL